MAQARGSSCPRSASRTAASGAPGIVPSAPETPTTNNPATKHDIARQSAPRQSASQTVLTPSRVVNPRRLGAPELPLLPRPALYAPAVSPFFSPRLRPRLDSSWSPMRGGRAGRAWRSKRRKRDIGDRPGPRRTSAQRKRRPLRSDRPSLFLLQLGRPKPPCRSSAPRTGAGGDPRTRTGPRSSWRA